jgi:hypothetical protein
LLPRRLGDEGVQLFVGECVCEIEFNRGCHMRIVVGYYLSEKDNVK